MSDDDKKTRKEGLDVAAREAIERISAKPEALKNADEKAPDAPAEKAHDEKSEKAAQNLPTTQETKTDAMTGEKIAKKPPSEPKKTPALLLAEYKSPGKCMHAAEKLRDAGYTKFDAHTPFPVHGMDKAMGLRDSRLGWIVIVCALAGTSTAFLMMWWMNCIDYPIVIGGKPPSASSIASMVPIMFELTILFSAFAAVFGMFGLNKIPQHHHPIFESDRFKSFSTDKFFISVEAQDPKFRLDQTRELLEKTHAEHVELVLHAQEEGK